MIPVLMTPTAAAKEAALRAIYAKDYRWWDYRALNEALDALAHPSHDTIDCLYRDTHPRKLYMTRFSSHWLQGLNPFVCNSLRHFIAHCDQYPPNAPN